MHSGISGIGGIYVVSGDDSCKDGGFHIIRFFQTSGKEPRYDTCLLYTSTLPDSSRGIFLLFEEMRGGRKQEAK